jgi:F-box and leucine-rich repeat protein GRR1
MSGPSSVCRHLTDMAVFELAGLANLQRLSLVRVHKLTDNAVFFLAEHAMGLERLHLSYCDRLSLFAIQHLLRKLAKLQHLSATGIPAFKRKGIKRFSDPAPSVSAIITFCRTA